MRYDLDRLSREKAAEIDFGFEDVSAAISAPIININLLIWLVGAVGLEPTAR